MNETTLFLSRIIGPVMVVLAVGIMANHNFYKKLYMELEKSPLPVLLAGILTLVSGILIVMKHNFWTSAAEIVVSLFGLLLLVKGLFWLLIPGVPMKIGKKFADSAAFPYVLLIPLAIGAYLSWFGYWA